MDEKTKITHFVANIYVLKQINCCFVSKTETLYCMFTVEAKKLIYKTVLKKCNCNSSLLRTEWNFYRSPATFKVMLIPTISESGAAVARNCKHTECSSVSHVCHGEHVINKNSKTIKQYVKPRPKELSGCRQAWTKLVIMKRSVQAGHWYGQQINITGSMSENNLWCQNEAGSTLRSQR